MPAMNRPGFLTKAGLRSLLTADEVWSLGRMKSLGEHNIPTEKTLLQTTGSKDLSDPQCFSEYNYRSKQCHNTSTERKGKRDDGKTALKQDSVKTNSKPCCYELKPAKKVKSPMPKTEPYPTVIQTRGTEIHSEEKVLWKPQKKVYHFNTEYSHPSSSENIPFVSCLPSDIEEDLPFDYEDMHQKPEQTVGSIPKTLKPHSSSFKMMVDCQVIADNLSDNVQNSHQSHHVVFNNNHEICHVSEKSNRVYTQTQEIDLVSQIPENLKWQKTKDSIIDKTLVTNSVYAGSSCIKRTDSPSCDDSLSEAEDKSEPFSLQSEGLVWSEEEKDAHSEEKSDRGHFALVYAERLSVIPESPPYCQQSSTKQCEVHPCNMFHKEQQMTAESNLSEILSPVDEVLSYGSAELPLSGVGPGVGINSLLLPSPAFEIITWTSEEDLPEPSDFFEDSSINSENIPPLPVDLSCKRDADMPNKTNIYNYVNNRDLCQILPVAEQDQEDEDSEHTSCLPFDESNENQDPLWSFNIEDRVLLCKPDVLKYKGCTAFAEGFWAGVAHDMPNGNHNGTIRGIKYFPCEKNCGVLVRAGDISHQCREHCNEVGTGMDEDTFWDEDHPSQDGGNGNKHSGNWQKMEICRERSAGHGLSAPKQTFQQKQCENDESKDNKLSTFSTFIEKSPLKLGYHTSHLDDSEAAEAVLERLTEEIFADALKNIQGIGSTQNSKPKEIRLKQKDPSNVINKPHLMDTWQQVYPVTPPQIQVKPHEHRIVYRLVDDTVETFCGQKNASRLDASETPNYLADDESRKIYKKVIFQLASDILHKICADLSEISGSFQKTINKSVIPLVQRRQISVTLLKNAVKRETQKVLNLEHTDQEMTEMLQTLCKYWYAKRDRVDYILIQELHNEEKEWVDYSNDQITVKMQLANEIFSFLLDDTIITLNHIYRTYSKQKII